MMNIDAETLLLEHVAAALRAQGLSVDIRSDRTTRPPDSQGAGLEVSISAGQGGQSLAYAAHVCASPLTPTTLGATLSKLSGRDALGRPTLLVAPYLTPPVARQLRAIEQPFADAAGNAYLNGPHLFVLISGFKPEVAQKYARPGRAYTPAGLKVMFALLCDPPLADAPHRVIAAAAGVALGSVPGALQAMQDENRLLVAGKRRRLHATKDLLDDWALAYARTLRPKTLLGTYETPAFDTWPSWKLDPPLARWGGEPAANLLQCHLRPGVLTIYAQRLPPALMVEQRMRAAGKPGAERTVEWRRPFWGDALRTTAPAEIVPAILVYADLLATGDARCIETAKMLYESELARFFPAH